MQTQLTHLRLPINGINLHVVAAGPTTGRPLIFLHGFPEFWWGWHKQVDHFANLGYRVIVPDQRGCGESEKSKSISDYGIETLADDVAALIRWAGPQKALIVGHDWGAAVAWWLAVRHPEYLERVVILNVPHPTVLMKNLSRNWRQLLKSWYIFFFQIPRLPEWILSRSNFWLLRRSLQRSSQKGTFSDNDLKKYVTAWSNPGTLTGMLNWYRGAFRVSPPKADPTVSVPLQIIWGAKDQFLSREMADQSLKYCTQGKLLFLEEATHWVQHEQAAAVNQVIELFFRKE